MIKRTSLYCLCAVLLCAGAFTRDNTNSRFRSLHVDASRVTGEIRSFQGLNGPPSPVMARASGAEVYYRIGRSFGANVDPPADFDKFASVVKHIAMHYNQGWANGFHDDIRYWEFWNEPEIFWSGTPEQFYSL